MKKYFELVDKNSTETLERVPTKNLTKKEIKNFLKLEIVNERYLIRLEYYPDKDYDYEIYDEDYNTLRRHLNINFPEKFTEIYR